MTAFIVFIAIIVVFGLLCCVEELLARLFRPTINVNIELRSDSPSEAESSESPERAPS